MKPCQCEHAAHFPDERTLTPNGNPGHDYGARFDDQQLADVHTEYGTFRVCRDCAADCLSAVTLNAEANDNA